MTSSPSYIEYFSDIERRCLAVEGEFAHACWHVPGLAAARKRWTDAKIEQYEYVLAESRPDGPLRLTGVSGTGPRMEELFDRAGMALNAPKDWSKERPLVKFDARLGYPLQIAVRGTHFEVRDFEVSDPSPSCPGGASSVNERVPLLGLLGLWRFDDCVDARVEDASASANHGSVRFGMQVDAVARTGGPWRPGVRGGALELRGPLGGPDWVDVRTHASLGKIAEAAALTISLWIRPSPSGRGTLVSRYDEQRQQLAFAFVFDGLRANCVIAGRKAYGKDVVPLGRWSHVAMTYDGSVCRILVDGGSALGTTIDQKLEDTATSIVIGAERGGPGGITSHYGGRIDDLAIYARVLSDQEIAELARR